MMANLDSAPPKVDSRTLDEIALAVERREGVRGPQDQFRRPPVHQIEIRAGDMPGSGRERPVCFRVLDDLLPAVTAYGRGDGIEAPQTAARRAVQLAPGSADAATFACFVLASSGFPEEGVAQSERAITLSPNYPGYYLGHLGNAYRLSGRIPRRLRRAERLPSAARSQGAC